MTWFDWILIALFSLGAVASVPDIGKPREPLTHGAVAFIAALNILFAICLLWSRGVF